MRNFNTSEQNYRLHLPAVLSYSAPTVAKSAAECGNSQKHQANSTPNRAFFVRSTRTPKINPSMDLFSMMACSGQGLALDCLPDVTVFHPVTRYRPTLWKMLAIALVNKHQELSQMLYKFLLLGEKRLTVRILANSEAEARQKLQFTSPAFCIARLNPSQKGAIYA